MPERSTAESRLSRVLGLLPRAARAGGVALAELARELEMEEREILADLQEVYTRAYYQRAGDPDDVQVLIESDQVEVWTSREFKRPPRLSPKEALALGLGLRVLAAESPERARPDMLAVAERLERGLAAGPPPEMLTGMALNPGGDSPEGIRAALHGAARSRRACEIAYLKPGSPAPDVRRVDPFVLLAADGRWYLVGRCHRSDDIRVFRADRVLGVTVLEEAFEVPDGFDPHLFVAGGQVFHATEGVEVPVRYSSRIARWIEERGPVEPREDGSVVVHYRVADPDWLVRHVLQHGPDAEVLGPPRLRERVRAAAERVRDLTATTRAEAAESPGAS